MYASDDEHVAKKAYFTGLEQLDYLESTKKVKCNSLRWNYDVK